MLETGSICVWQRNELVVQRPAVHPRSADGHRISELESLRCRTCIIISGEGQYLDMAIGRFGRRQHKFYAMLYFRCDVPAARSYISPSLKYRARSNLVHSERGHSIEQLSREERTITYLGFGKEAVQVHL